MKKFVLVIATIALFTNVKAQEGDGLEAILLAGGDTEKLVQAYMNPAMKGLIFGMNSGWYHTAKVHKVLGFDITIGLNASVVPTEDEIFRFADLGLTSVTADRADSPTVGGPNSNLANVTFNGTVDGQNVSATFTMPGGIKDDVPLNAMPTPAVQVAVGLPWKLEGTLRLVPQVGDDDVKGNLLGIGVKKEITSWFGPMDKTPLHVSLFAAYTSMSVDYNIQNESSINGSNQRAEFDLSAYTVEAIGSLNFPFINIYGGFGYSTGTSDLKMLGTYELEYDTGNPAPNDTVTDTVVDPLNMEFDASGFKTTLGARISLGFFKIFGSYTFQEYNTFNAGIALSFR